MKSIFTVRLALISLIFGSSGYGLKTALPIQHCDTYSMFPWVGFMVAALTSFLISILLPTRIHRAYKMIYNLVFVGLFIVSVIFTFIFFRSYTSYTFHPYELVQIGDSSRQARINDTLRYFQSGVDGLVPDLKKAVAEEGVYNASNIYLNAGGLEAYSEYAIWTKESMDESAFLLLIYYILFIVSLIATTFAFMEVLKNRKYSEDVKPRKESVRKSPQAAKLISAENSPPVEKEVHAEKPVHARKSSHNEKPLHAEKTLHAKKSEHVEKSSHTERSTHAKKPIHEKATHAKHPVNDEKPAHHKKPTPHTEKATHTEKSTHAKKPVHPRKPPHHDE